MAAWGDSESSDSDDEEEQVANLYFMVNENQFQEDEIEYESSDEVDCSEFLEYSKNQILVQDKVFEKKQFVIFHLKKKCYKNQTTNFTQRLKLLRKKRKHFNPNMKALKRWF